MSTGLTLSAVGLRRTFRTGFSVGVESLEVPSGKTLAILGPSGSGKSTLLSLLGLLETPDEGRVLLDGREVTPRDREARLLMAAVFQRPYLIKGTVEANVAYGLALRHVSAAERATRVATALERVGLGSLGKRYAATLSGGEAQRVALARALVLEPRVLLLDEPLASLDPLLKRRLVSDFASILRAEGVTVVYVTHDHDEARVVADDIAIMNEGRIVAYGPAADVMALPADEWTADFLGMETPGHGIVQESADGVVHIEVSPEMTIVAAASFPAGTNVAFTVAPEDVLLAAADTDAGGLSARNHLLGMVDRVEPRGATWRVTVRFGETTLAAAISQSALVEMQLAEGQQVQAVFKATAVRVAPLS